MSSDFTTNVTARYVQLSKTDRPGPAAARADAATHAGKEPQPVSANRDSAAAPDARAVGHELSKAAERLNDLVQSMHRELRFSVDDESGRSVIKVIDSSSREVIRQIPPEEVLALVAHMEEFDSGLVHEQA